MTELEKITQAARAGALHLWQLAYLWALDYWDRTGEFPLGDAIPPGVRDTYHVRQMHRDTAYAGLKRLKQSLPKINPKLNGKLVGARFKAALDKNKRRPL